MLRPGDIIGDYEVLAELTSGGMGTLFLARRSGAAGFERRVAIKVIHPHLARDPSFVRLFVDEALLAAQIQHPNVVHVDELREAQDTYFQVMDYVAGCSLWQLQRALARLRRRMTPAVAVAIAAQVAEGLHAAHETVGRDGVPLGVVHRDVSPQNVLLSEQGHVKLIDFGVAKARGRERTATGHLRGKLRYMAPEQTRSGPVDRRADVYALGAVLWELLTLRQLHETDNEFDLLARVRAAEIVPPSRYASGIPPALDALLMAALAPDPARRPPDARTLRARLLDALPAAVTADAAHLAGLVAFATGGDPEDDLHGAAAALNTTAHGPHAGALMTSTLQIPDDTPVSYDDDVRFDDDRTTGNVANGRTDAFASEVSYAERAGRRTGRRAAMGAWLVAIALAAVLVGGGVGLVRRAGAGAARVADAPTTGARGQGPSDTAGARGPSPSDTAGATGAATPGATTGAPGAPGAAATAPTNALVAAPPALPAAPAADAPDAPDAPPARVARRNAPRAARTTRRHGNARHRRLVHGVPIAVEPAQ